MGRVTGVAGTSTRSSTAASTGLAQVACGGFSFQATVSLNSGMDRDWAMLSLRGVLNPLPAGVGWSWGCTFLSLALRRRKSTPATTRATDTTPTPTPTYRRDTCPRRTLSPYIYFASARPLKRDEGQCTLSARGLFPLELSSAVPGHVMAAPPRRGDHQSGVLPR